jgi:hypothetical protein
MTYPLNDPPSVETPLTSNEKIEFRISSWKKWSEKYSLLKTIKTEVSYQRNLIALHQRRFELPFNYRTISLH